MFKPIDACVLSFCWYQEHQVSPEMIRFSHVVSHEARHSGPEQRDSFGSRGRRGAERGVLPRQTASEAWRGIDSKEERKKGIGVERRDKEGMGREKGRDEGKERNRDRGEGRAVENDVETIPEGEGWGTKGAQLLVSLLKGETEHLCLRQPRIRCVAPTANVFLCHCRLVMLTLFDVAGQCSWWEQETALVLKLDAVTDASRKLQAV